MAKIYETQKDVERERLSGDAKEAKHRQRTGAMLAVFGLPLVILNPLQKSHVRNLLKTEGFWKRSLERLKDRSGWVMGISHGILVAGIIEFFDYRKQAKKAEAELAKLGPEEIVLPNAPQSVEAVEGKHVARLQNEAAAEGQIFK